MKKLLSLLPLIALWIAMQAFIPAPAGGSEITLTPGADKKVEVLYFHFTRRCMTCNNVESVSKKAVESNYPEQVKKGDISFKSINIEEKEGEAIGKKYAIEGQTLVVICGDKRVDLTEKAFMYANNNPEKLTAEIKKAIDGMIK